MTSTLRTIAILSLLCSVSGAQDRSKAFQRYAASDLEFEFENTFFPNFNHKLVTGLGYNADPAQDPLVQKKVAVYRLYYKGHGADTQYGEPFHIGWGVPIADRPEGPFVKSKLNPVVCGGHEVMIFPYQSGVVGFVRQGPELYSMQYAEDGLNFRLVSHVTEVPHAGAFFRKGHFKDIDKHPAEFPKWGLAHDYRLGSGEAFMVRFDLHFPATIEQMKGLSQ